MGEEEKGADAMPVSMVLVCVCVERGHLFLLFLFLLLPSWTKSSGEGPSSHNIYIFRVP